MQIKIRPDDARMIQNNDWQQTNDWLAELRDGGAARPPGDGQSEPDGDGDPRPEARAGAEVDARAGVAARTVIDDQLQMPITSCQIGSHISWHADMAALGEAGTRARAIAADWRIDPVGRLACPRCQQTDPATGPPARSRYRTATWPSPGPPGWPGGPAAVPSAAPRPEAAVTPAARPPRLPARRSQYGIASTRLLRPCRRAGALIASQRLRSRGMVLDAARAWRGYGGRWHPPMPVSTARAW